MSRKKCAACGRADGQMMATVWIGEKRANYCHDDDGDCYSPATWAGYPEMREPSPMI
ncbi:hypothetical protein [Microbacterium gilvum]|uniref:Uncharacterized protein n=1 Tax=Microbacterium gilvum TaxID=1336204 RepID=A0ABP9A8A1_9MICO